MENSKQPSFGIISVFLHWSIVLICFGLFALGLWMVDLKEGHDWFLIAPFFHKLIGTLLLFLIIMRFLWTKLTPPPLPLPNHKPWEIKTAQIVHFLLNFLLLIICISGNVMLLAIVDPYSVHGGVNLSDALGVDNLKDLAHKAHLYLAYLLMVLVFIHVLAVLKHQFVDKDRTLRRILGL